MNDADDAARSDATVVAPGSSEQALLWIGFPLAGAAAGWLLKLVAVWVATISWVPLPGYVRFVVELADGAPHATAAALVLGAVSGVVIATLARAEQVTVRVGDDQVVIRRDGAEQRVDRSAIAAVFREDGQLVVQDERGGELVRQKVDLDGEVLEAAFRARGYPWTATDPRGHEFRRWVTDLPGLPEGADALLIARSQALDEDDAEDAAQLQGELARLGIVVRDDGRSRQFVRPIDPGCTPHH